MKISSIRGNSTLYTNRFNPNNKIKRITNPEQKTQEISFQSNAGKIVGGILGTVAITVLAPGIAVMGLAGLGALTGVAVGHAIDEKIEENENKNGNEK